MMQRDEGWGTEMLTIKCAEVDNKKRGWERRSGWGRRLACCSGPDFLPILGGVLGWIRRFLGAWPQAERRAAGPQTAAKRGGGF